MKTYYARGGRGARIGKSAGSNSKDMMSVEVFACTLPDSKKDRLERFKKSRAKFKSKRKNNNRFKRKMLVPKTWAPKSMIYIKAHPTVDSDSKIEKPVNNLWWNGGCHVKRDEVSPFNRYKDGPGKFGSTYFSSCGVLNHLKSPSVKEEEETVQKDVAVIEEDSAPPEKVEDNVVASSSEVELEAEIETEVVNDEIDFNREIVYLENVNSEEIPEQRIVAPPSEPTPPAWVPGWGTHYPKSLESEYDDEFDAPPSTFRPPTLSRERFEITHDKFDEPPAPSLVEPTVPVPPAWIPIWGTHYPKGLETEYDDSFDNEALKGAKPAKAVRSAGQMSTSKEDTLAQIEILEEDVKRLRVEFELAVQRLHSLDIDPLNFTSEYDRAYTDPEERKAEPESTLVQETMQVSAPTKSNSPEVEKPSKVCCAPEEGCKENEHRFCSEYMEEYDHCCDTSNDLLVPKRPLHWGPKLSEYQVRFTDKTKVPKKKKSKDPSFEKLKKQTARLNHVTRLRTQSRKARTMNTCSVGAFFGKSYKSSANAKKKSNKENQLSNSWAVDGRSNWRKWNPILKNPRYVSSFRTPKSEYDRKFVPFF